MKQNRLFRIFVLFLTFVLVVPHSLLAAKKNKRTYQVSARAAIFSNSTKVKRYYGKNVHTKVLPASTTKVMTALLALEHLPLDKVVTVHRTATYPQPSKIYVKPGEKYRVRDLIYAVMLKSANDAAVVLAQSVAGSEKKFVRMMNKRARALGAVHTKFANSHGLPTKPGTQYTTPYDMYLIFRAALKQSFFKTVVRHKYKTISTLGGRKIKLKSHNKLLFNNWKKKIYGKTGYTRAAKACFVGYLLNGNDICIIAVFGCSRRWDDISHIIRKYGGIAL